MCFFDVEMTIEKKFIKYTKFADKKNISIYTYIPIFPVANQFGITFWPHPCGAFRPVVRGFFSLISRVDMLYH